jgi:hypothetical protein
MKYSQERFKKLFEHVTKSTIKENEVRDLIVKAGEELYHGTVENFTKEKARVGGYDNIFWTTKDPAISQTYIPVAGSQLYASSQHLVMPAQDQQTRNFQKSIGIDYDYSQVTFDRGNLSSYREAPIFKPYSDEEYNVRQEWYKAKTKLDEFAKEFNKLHWSKQTDEMISQYEELENNLAFWDKKDREVNLPKIKNEYVNNKLIELGYKPETDEAHHSNFNWKVKMANNTIVPADYRAQGRLLIVTPKKDLKIYDTTKGREGDLTDVDYHKHDWFKAAEAQGYDGIQIHDFAQSNDQGNFGHKSIGLFQSTLRDVSIEEIDAIHHDLDQFYQKKDYRTPEYHAFKARQQGIKEAFENGHCDNIKITPEIRDYVSQFGTDEELLRSGGLPIDMLDRAAHGFADSDIETLMPDQLSIKWKDDLEGVKWEIKKKGWTDMQYAKSVDLSEPIDVSYENGKFFIEDGHHRYWAAKILKRPLNVNLEIKDKPLNKLAPNLSYDDYHRCLFQVVNGATT